MVKNSREMHLYDTYIDLVKMKFEFKNSELEHLVIDKSWFAPVNRGDPAASGIVTSASRKTDPSSLSCRRSMPSISLFSCIDCMLNSLASP